MGLKIRGSEILGGGFPRLVKPEASTSGSIHLLRPSFGASAIGPAHSCMPHFLLHLPVRRGLLIIESDVQIG